MGKEATSKNPRKNFLATLIKSREDKDFDLKRLSEKSKISIPYLEKIESGDWSFLPTPYVRSFIRTYAQIVQMDVDETLEEFDNLTGIPKIPIPLHAKDDEPAGQAYKQSREPRKSKEAGQSFASPSFSLDSVPGNPLYWVIGIITIVVVVFAAIYWPDGNDEIVEPSFDEVMADHSSMVNDALAEDTTQVEPKKEEVVVPVEQVQRLELSIEATSEAYVRITADGADTALADIVLPEGFNRSYSADSIMTVVMGNAGGTKLVLNGKDLGTLGEEGRVLTVFLDKNGVRRVRRGVLRAPKPEVEEEAASVQDDVEADTTGQ